MDGERGVVPPRSEDDQSPPAPSPWAVVVEYEMDPWILTRETLGRRFTGPARGSTILLSCLGLVTTCTTAWLTTTFRSSWSSWAPAAVAVGAVVWILLLAVVLVVPPHRKSQALLRRVGARRRAAFSDEGILAHTPGKQERQFPWSSYPTSKEDRTGYWLYTEPAPASAPTVQGGRRPTAPRRGFVWVPKSALARPADETELRRLLSDHTAAQLRPSPR